MKKLVLFVAIAAMALMTGVASADIIYDNGSHNSGYIWVSDYSYGAVEADSFVLAAGANTIKDIHWWGAYYKGVTADDFTIKIYDTPAGAVLPGAELYTIKGAVTRTTTGVIGENGLEIYYYSIVINPIALAAGETFWLEIANNTDGAEWGWSTSSSGSHVASLGEGWEILDEELAFNLTDDTQIPPTGVPEPATMMLLGLGLAGVAVARKKFRK